MSSETVQSKEMSHVVYDAELLEKKYGFKLPSQKYVTGTRSVKCEDHSLFFKSFKCSTCHPSSQSLCLLCCIKSHVGHVIQKVDELEIIPLSSESFQIITPVNVETKAKAEHVSIVSPAESVSDIESVDMDRLIEEVRCDANVSLKYCELSLTSKSTSGFHETQNSEMIVEMEVVSSEHPVIVTSSVGPLEEGIPLCLDTTKSAVATELSVPSGELSHFTLLSCSTANAASNANMSTEVEINTPASVTYSKHSDGDGEELLCDTFGIESVAAADREVSDKPDSITAVVNVESNTHCGWDVEGVNVAPSIPMEVSEDATADESLSPNIVTTEVTTTEHNAASAHSSMQPFQCTQLLIVCEPVDYVVVGEPRNVPSTCDGRSGILVAERRKRKAAAMALSAGAVALQNDATTAASSHHCDGAEQDTEHQQSNTDAPMSVAPESTSAHNVASAQCAQLIIVCEPVDYVVVGEPRSIPTGDGVGNELSRSGILVARSRKRKLDAMSGASDSAGLDNPVTPVSSHHYGDAEQDTKHPQSTADAPMSIDPSAAQLTELCGADALLMLSRRSSFATLPPATDAEASDVGAPDCTRQSHTLSELLVVAENVAADPMEMYADGDNTTAAVAVTSEITESVVPITTCDKQGTETKTTAVDNEDAVSVSSVLTCGSPTFPILSFPTMSTTVPVVQSSVALDRAQPSVETTASHTVPAEEFFYAERVDTATLDHSALSGEPAQTITPTSTDHTAATMTIQAAVSAPTASETTVPTQTTPQLTASSSANTVNTLPAPSANDYILFGYAEVPDAALCDMSLGVGYVSAVSEGENLGKYRLEHMMLPLDEKDMLHTAYEMDVQQDEEVLIDSDSIACNGIQFVKGKRKTRSGDAQWHLTEKSQQAIKRVKLFRDIFGEQGRKLQK